MKKLTTAEFIEKARKIHGDFLCSPNRHLNGQMCPKCVGSSMEKEVLKEERKIKR